MFDTEVPEVCGYVTVKVWGRGMGPSPGKNICFLYNGSVVRVSASYSSDLTVG